MAYEVKISTNIFFVKLANIFFPAVAQPYRPFIDTQAKPHFIDWSGEKKREKLSIINHHFR
jgi:hypothetical protein